ncbi:hypothetical protein GCM10010275_55580 [Streptomyces litmocidini]|uniref:DUF4232 domain-containing protein n=1 Tax=Streptomyces litmocidini TaxID=67318 RepID=UPI00167D345A|nr:DUF4232 domain-containing protein [Streptomyces litmocidini]GGV08233.1 hypothetical protein GCM10010275_55580 [Streptomyces litmocidini]
MLHTRKAVAAAIGLVAALSLTACNGDDNASAGTQTSPTASADKAGGTGGADQADQSAGTGTGGSDQSTGTSTGGSDQGSGTGTGTGTGDNGDGKVGICRTDELEVAAADNTTDKTEGVVTVSFKNSGGSDCRISGFAGVDLKTSLGDTFSVDRNGEQALPQILKEGETAAFNITFPVNNSGGSGVQPTDIVVTPPNETKHVTLKWPAGTLPVTDGKDGGKLEISPVGKVSDSPAG